MVTQKREDLFRILRQMREGKKGVPVSDIERITSDLQQSGGIDFDQLELMLDRPQRAASVSGFWITLAIILGILGLVAAMVAGLILMSLIRDLKSDLNRNFEQLNGSVSTMQQRLDRQQDELVNQQTKMSTLQTRVAQLPTPAPTVIPAYVRIFRGIVISDNPGPLSGAIVHLEFREQTNAIWRVVDRDETDTYGLFEARDPSQYQQGFYRLIVEKTDYLSVHTQKNSPKMPKNPQWKLTSSDANSSITIESTIAIQGAVMLTDFEFHFKPIAKLATPVPPTAPPPPPPSPVPSVVPTTPPITTTTQSPTTITSSASSSATSSSPAPSASSAPLIERVTKPVPSGQKLYSTPTGENLILSIESGTCLKYRRMGEEQGRIKIQLLIQGEAPSFSKEKDLFSGEKCPEKNQPGMVGKLQLDSVTLIGWDNALRAGWLTGYVDRSFENQ